MQPEAGIAYYDEEERINIVVAGQWAHEDREQVAHALEFILRKRFELYILQSEAHSAAGKICPFRSCWLWLYMKLKDKGIDRPVKTVWDRRESIIGHHKRHQYKIKTKWGANKRWQNYGCQGGYYRGWRRIYVYIQQGSWQCDVDGRRSLLYSQCLGRFKGGVH